MKKNNLIGFLKYSYFTYTLNITKYLPSFNSTLKKKKRNQKFPLNSLLFFFPMMQLGKYPAGNEWQNNVCICVQR